MFWGYLDDSGDDDLTGLMTVSCFIGHWSHLFSFEAAWGRVLDAKNRQLIAVSADAKIPIVRVEFSPPLDVVNRNALRMEEVPRLVKGERRARAERTATARDEHPGDQ